VTSYSLIGIDEVLEERCAPSSPYNNIVILKTETTGVFETVAYLCQLYEVLPKISENLDIPRKPLELRTCAARCLLPYLSTVSQPTCAFISARVSEFWLFSLHRMTSYPSRQTSDIPVTKMQIQQLNQPAFQPTLIEWIAISQDKGRTQKRPQCWHAASSSVS